MKIALRNLSKGWFSLAKKHGTRLELKIGARVILDINEEDLNYYKQFIPLGISLEVLKECIPEPIEDKPTELFNNIDEIVDKDIKDDGIDVIKPEYEHLERHELEKLTKPQLKELCKSLYIKFNQKALKNELIELLLKEYGDNQ